MDRQITFDALVKAFLEDKKVRTKPTTFIGYECITRNYILPSFTGRDIFDIKPLEIREWQNMMLESHLSQRYLRRVDTCLVSVFNYGMRFYELQRNPAILAGSIGCGDSHRINFWTLKEFTKFIDAVKSPESRMAFVILYWTGMRVGELLALTPADINLSKREISVNKSFRRYHGNDIISTPKTKKSNRTISINTSLTRDIREYLKSLKGIRPTSRIFPFTRDRLHYQMRLACKLTGVKEIRIHDLRHSHASLLIEMNVTPLLISERLGHEKVETTLNIYSHLYPNKQRQLSDKIEHYYNGEG